MTETERKHPMTVREERRAKDRAKTALIAALAPLVDLSTLRDGEHGFDYCLDVPVQGYHELTDRIGDIQYDINARFGVWARVWALPRR
jgi:hypothetical protein